MNRRLIIITNDGGKEDFLAGVSVDRQCYINYFSSPEGGAWERNEMFLPTTNSCSPAMLYAYMLNQEEKCHVDYWVVVFCGHGGATYDGKTYFCFQNTKKCFSEQIFRFSIGSRILLIADSCRSLPEYEQGGVLNQRIYCNESLNDDEIYRRICRNIYNQKVLLVPLNTITKGYASSFTEYANEYEDGTGGYYSQALIESAKAEIKDAIIRRQTHPNKFTTDIASFSWIYAQAKQRVVELTNGKQNPVLVSPRTNQLPFYVVPAIALLS